MKILSDLFSKLDKELAKGFYNELAYGRSAYSISEDGIRALDDCEIDEIIEKVNSYDSCPQ